MMKKFPINRIIILGLLPLALSSCLVAKKYETPKSVENSERFRDVNNSDTTSLANISWKDFFQDQTLQGYIDKALSNNLDMKVAIRQIDIATAYVKQGKAGFAPNIGANLSASNQQPSKNTKLGALVGSTNQFELSANLSWEADIWGKIRSQKRAADADFLGTVAAKQAIQTRLIASVVSTYYGLLAIDKQIKITKESIENRREGVETIKALQTAGTVNAAAVQQMEAQLYTSQDILLDLENQARLLENALSILMGEAPHQISRTNLDGQQLNAEIKVGVPSQLLANRPDVIIAENKYRSAFEMTNVARAYFYPSFTLTASGGLQSLKVRDLFSVNSLFANLLGGLTQPIFNQRRIRTQYEVAQARQDIALIGLQNSLLNAGREVVDALSNYQTSTSKLTVKEKEYQAYQNAYDYSQDLLANGLANYLEVLTAQQSVLSTQLDLVNTKLNQLNSMVELYRALGGGTR